MYKRQSNAYVVGTNAASGNFIRAFRPDLSTYWTLDIGSDAITNEINSDVTRAYTFVPVGAGGGGIYGLDLSVAPVGGLPPKPAGWPTQKILSGVMFRSQCRTPFGWPVAQTRLLCGSSTGTLYALDQATGSTVATASVTGSIQSVLPVSNAAGVIIYSTRSGRVGRMHFDGTAFTSTFEVTVPGAVVVSTPVFVNSRNAIYVGANGALHKLDSLTGAPVASRTLDGLQVSEVGFDAFSGTLFVETSAGTIWGVPFF